VWAIGFPVSLFLAASPALTRVALKDRNELNVGVGASGKSGVPRLKIGGPVAPKYLGGPFSH